MISKTENVIGFDLGHGETSALVVDENENIEVEGWSVKGPVKGEVVL